MKKILLGLYLSLMVCSTYGETVNTNWVNLEEIKDIKTLSKIKNGTIYQEVNGKKSICGKIVNGSINGKLITYYKNGNKKCMGTCINNKPEGKWVFYYDNGNKQLEGSFKNGKKNGKWDIYNLDGKIEKNEIYKDNKLVENR